MSGTFGYELDIPELSEEEKEEVRSQIELFKKDYSIIQEGLYYRLTDDGRNSPFVSWEFVSEDQTKALINIVTLRTKANPILHTVYAKGLKPESVYMVEETGHKLTGAALMYGGYPVPKASDDYEAVQLHLTEQ